MTDKEANWSAQTGKKTPVTEAGLPPETVKAVEDAFMNALNASISGSTVEAGAKEKLKQELVSGFGSIFAGNKQPGNASEFDTHDLAATLQSLAGDTNQAAAHREAMNPRNLQQLSRRLSQEHTTAMETASDRMGVASSDETMLALLAIESSYGAANRAVRELMKNSPQPQKAG